MNLSVEEIVCDQTRVVNSDRVAQYKKDFEQGRDVPPILVDYSNQLVDGIHRLTAARLLKHKTIAAERHIQTPLDLHNRTGIVDAIAKASREVFSRTPFIDRRNASDIRCQLASKKNQIRLQEEDQTKAEQYIVKVTGQIASLQVCLVARWIREAEHLWKKQWFGYFLIAVGVVFCIWFNWHLQPAGYAITAMAVVAGVMALRQDMGGREKWVWFALLLAFMVVEMRAINKDAVSRNDTFSAIGHGIETEIESSKALMLQTLGSDGSPYFLALIPRQGNLSLIKVTSFTGDGLPIFDVTVELSKRPLKGSSEFDKSVLTSLGHPTHYDLGTILPNEIMESPIKLSAPGRYYFRIATRRGSFYEKINIDSDPHLPGGWAVSECLYRDRDNKLLEGKCD